MSLGEKLGQLLGDGAAEFFRIHDGDDVRVDQASGQGSLAHELHRGGSRALRLRFGQVHLDREIGVEELVIGEVDHARLPAAEFRPDLILADSPTCFYSQFTYASQTFVNITMQNCANNDIYIGNSNNANVLHEFINSSFGNK